MNKESGQSSRVSIDTYGSKIHVEWDPAAAVTPFPKSDIEESKPSKGVEIKGDNRK
ncbi:MAG: hypothetical protein H7844_09305 [Nitrospirae bacterium YQR-1]